MSTAIPAKFRPRPRGLLVACVSAVFAQAALADGGHVDFTAGSVTVTNIDGRVRPLVKNAEVRSGDRIVSGVDGRAQIRFSDGAYVSLQPNSDFDIKEYRFEGRTDGTESAVFSLFKGALRTVTGLVGRVNRSKYQITTPTATIGIRGTGGLVQVGADGSTLVTGTSGVWTLANNGGTLQIPAGTSGFAGANTNLAPEQSTQGPVVPPPQPPQDTQTAFVQGNSVGPQGAPLGPVLTTGPGYAIANADGGVGGIGFSGSHTPADVVFDSSGRVVQFPIELDGPCCIATVTLTNGFYASPDTGTDGVLAWGRWIGQAEQSSGGVVIKTVTYSENQGLHYVVGTPSAVLPASGTFTYNLIGATSPTFANGANAPGKLDAATLTGDFTNAAVAVMLKATAAGMTFAGTATGSIGTLLGPAGFSASGTSDPASTGCGVSGCFISVNGFFAGTGATHAGITYNFSSTVQGSTLSGAAALKQ